LSSISATMLLQEEASISNYAGTKLVGLTSLTHLILSGSFKNSLIHRSCYSFMTSNTADVFPSWTGHFCMWSQVVQID
jgi:hypothetical protein